VRALGLDGPFVALADNYPVPPGNFDFRQRLGNLTSDGTVWVELWWRENLQRITARPHVFAWIFEAGNSPDPAGGQRLIRLDNTWGGWRKMGFRFRAPVTKNGWLGVSLRSLDGVVEIDGLRIIAVSDRELDTLDNFVEGTEER
jgi:hypothetical protein